VDLEYGIVLVTGDTKKEIDMGIYDTVVIPCPECGELYYAQSKGSYECSLRHFDLWNAPSDVMSDVNRHAPFECECGTIFDVEMSITSKVRILGRKE